MATLKVGTGSTTAGTGWQVYTPDGIYIDINTSAAQFSSVPVYVASLRSNTPSSQWKVVGVDGIYNATATSFRIYIRWVDGSALSPATANANGWMIDWIGIGS
jgi:hypothetical protein